MPYKNPNYHKEYMKEYHIKNKERQKEYRQTPQGKKSIKIAKWKYKGLINDNIDELYDRWLNSTECELCGHNYSFNKKCLDHDHQTGLFRNIVCHSCNQSSKLKEMYKTNKSGYKNIQITESNTFRVQLTINKISYRKSFKILEEAILYRNSLLK